MKPVRDTVLLRERTDVGPITMHNVPRFKLVGKAGRVFFAEALACGPEVAFVKPGDVLILDAYDVAHSVPAGMLAPEKAMLARIAGSDDSVDPVPLWNNVLTEWREERGGLYAPDGRRSDDVKDGISKIHTETIVACGPFVPRTDDLQGRFVFGEGPDTPTLYWGGRRLRFVPWERGLAIAL